jgi:hypothetical protein
MEIPVQRSSAMGGFSKCPLALGVSATLLAGSLLTAGTALAATKSTDFDLAVSKGAATCLPHANGKVHVGSVGIIMTVDLNGLPPKSHFDLFVLQLPTAPFGVSWYQANIPTNKDGHGHVRVIGRFSSETFAVAPGSGSAPVTFTSHPVGDEGNSDASASINPHSARSRCITSACGSIHRLTRRTPAAPMQ